MCHAIHRYAEANNKYLKNYNKNEEPSYIRYLDANNLYGWTMSQKLLVKEFKWVKDTVSPDKKHNKVIKLIKNMMKVVIKDTYLKQICIVIHHSYQGK